MGVGGSFEYTGAPYYSAYSALKVGSDLAMVFCTEAASYPIKSYSPELIVYPVLATKSTDISEQESIEKVLNNVDKLHALVIGPGLGRDDVSLSVASGIIEKMKTKEIPLILDGDALWLLSKNRTIIKGAKNCVLLPNAVEFKRLQSSENQTASELSKELGVMVVQKGKYDTIVDGSYSAICDRENSPRRCGGQGDLLAGSMAVFMAWATKFIQSQPNMNQEKESKIRVSAAYGACSLTRECNQRAFKIHHRGATTVEMIHEIPQAFYDMFDNDEPE